MGDMARTDLDSGTAERLIAGRAWDLPPGFERVAAVLEAARLSATQRDTWSLDATVAAMVAAVGPQPATAPDVVRPARSSRLPKLLAGSVAGFMALFGGLAAAGALPSAAQNPVADIVAHVGIDLPGSGTGTHHQGTNDTQPATATTPTTEAARGDKPANESTVGSPQTTVAAPPCPTPAPDNHGGFVSDAAHPATTESTVNGENHGADVSAAAKSDCGKPPQAGNDGAPGTTTTTEAPKPDNGAGGGNGNPDGNPGRGSGQPTGSSGSDGHRPPTA